MEEQCEDLGPKCFGIEGKVVSWNGVNYYPACDEFVYVRSEGGESYCVKRSGHPSTDHEAYDGTKRETRFNV